MKPEKQRAAKKPFIQKLKSATKDYADPGLDGVKRSSNKNDMALRAVM